MNFEHFPGTNKGFNPIDANDNNLNPNEYYCPHGAVEYKESKSAKNPGRYFICCKLSQYDPDKCKWLGWQDELDTEKQSKNIAKGKIPEKSNTSSSHYDNTKKRKFETNTYTRLDAKSTKEILSKLNLILEKIEKLEEHII